MFIVQPFMLKYKPSMTEAAWLRPFIHQHRLAHLATVDRHHHPHVIPIVYAYDGEQLYTPLDAKPKRVGVYRLRRVQNIQANPRVAIIIDHYDEDWQKLAWVQLRGQARLVESGPDHQTGITLLEAKYPQYTTMPLKQRPLIAIHITHLNGWRATPQ